jgi:polyferredoxin
MPFSIPEGTVVTKRRFWQTGFLVLLNLPLIGQLKYVCLPVLNCHSCPWAVFACPVGVVAHFATWAVIPLLALGTVAFIGAVFGRFLCGWVCPFGLLQDWLYKIPSPKWTLPRWTRYSKYVILVITVIAVPILLGIHNYAFFCKLCPAGTLESLLPRSVAAGNYSALAESWIRLSVLSGMVLLAIVALRSFCKLFCPIGAFLALFNRFSAFGLTYNQAECPNCELCLEKCPMDIQLDEFQDGKDPEVVKAPPECIMCLECTHNCRRSGLRFTFWNLIPLQRKDRNSGQAGATGTREVKSDGTA